MKHHLDDIIRNAPCILMNGAIGTELKFKHGISEDSNISWASFYTDTEACEAMRCLIQEYATVSSVRNIPMLITTATRRANRTRIEDSIYGSDVNEINISLYKRYIDCITAQVYIGGMMGCKGNPYHAYSEFASPISAQEFHSWQADRLALGGADFLFAGIMPNVCEAAGMALAMEQTGLPYIISFMINETGKLLDGTYISDAITTVDNIVKNVVPVCYMVNCIHPRILYRALSVERNRTLQVKERFAGIRANASMLPINELDDRKTNAGSSPVELAADMLRLKRDFGLRIFGGCCGTELGHIEAIANIVMINSTT